MVLYDTFGDGWNNSGVDLIAQNGDVLFTGGGPSYTNGECSANGSPTVCEYEVCVPGPGCYLVKFTFGSYPNEHYWFWNGYGCRGGPSDAYGTE